MLDFLGGAEGSGYGAAVLWTLAALLALAIVLFIVRTIRSLTFGTFVAGGRNRKTRLAVMDATAVDSHRRLVLVRRDDIEHLLLIGGPTDVVVERDIRLAASRRPNLTADAATAAQRPGAPPPPRQGGAHAQPPGARPAAAQPPRASAPATPVQAPDPARPAAVPPAGPAAAPKPAGAAHGEAHKTPPAEGDSLDDSLMSELALSLGEEQHAGGAATKATARSASLDDEMARLLNEFSTKR